MKTKIALLAGGYTGEAEVSYRSASFVSKNIDTSLFDVYLINITKKEWLYVDEKGESHTINRKDFSLTINEQQVVLILLLS